MTARLNTDPNMMAPDAVYAALVEMHRDLSDQQSAQASARLILLLANHIGDLGLLKEAAQRARASLD